jgi:hypothetical protein
MQARDHMNIKKNLIEILIFLSLSSCIWFLERKFQVNIILSFQRLFYAPSPFVGIIERDKGVLKTYGIRTDNLKEATRLSALFSVPWQSPSSLFFLLRIILSRPPIFILQFFYTPYGDWRSNLCFNHFFILDF